MCVFGERWGGGGGVGVGGRCSGESAVSMTFGNESLLKCTSYLSRRETLIEARGGLFLRRGCWRRRRRRSWRRRWRRRSLRREGERSHHPRQHCLSSWGTSQWRHGKFDRLRGGNSLTHRRCESPHPLDIIIHLQKRAHPWYSESPLKQQLDGWQKCSINTFKSRF